MSRKPKKIQEDHSSEKQAILFLNVLSLPASGEFVGIENKLQMADNLSGPSTLKDRYIEPFESTVQINASVILVCKGGEATIRVNFEDYVMREGDVAIVISGNFLHVMDYSDDLVFAAIALNYGLFDISDNALVPMSLIKHFMARPVFHIDEETMSDCLDVYHFMKKRLMIKDFIYKEELARNCISTLVYMAHQILLDNDTEIESPTDKSRQQQIFEKFINEVNRHFIHDRNVYTYAERLCITPKYLSAIVKQVSGKSANDWINDYVVLEAKALLRVKWNTIKDVSNKLNFPNQSFFAKYFKQHTGMTPKEYKQKG